MSGEDLAAKMQSLGLDKTPEEFIESLTPDVQSRVKVLQELQKQRDEHELLYRKELLELETKYEKLYAPLYVERTEIVSGTKKIDGNTSDDKGIPDFWITVLMKCEATRVYITEKDAEVLKFLTNIEAESMVKDEQLQGFKLNFIFAANPFFSQTVLEKSYFMLPDNDGVLEKAEGTKIEWSAGKDVTVKLMKKKAKKGSKPSAKPEMKTEKVDSFFNFFDPPKIPEEEDDIDDEAMEELQATVEGDYELGAVIREKLVPDAAAWYTGEAAEDEDMMGYDYGEDEEFEGEDDEAEEGAVADPKQQPPECKQQ